MLLFMRMNVSRNILSCDALFFVISPKTRNVSLFIILVSSQKLISGSIFSMLEHSLYSPKFVLCSEQLTLRTKRFSHPQPYCSQNYITTLSYKHLCSHETWAHCWSSVDPPSQCWPSIGQALCLCLVLAGMSFRVTCVIHFSPLWHGGPYQMQHTQKTHGHQLSAFMCF